MANMNSLQIGDQDLAEDSQLSVLSDEDLNSLRNMLYKRLAACGWRNKIREMVYEMLQARGVYNVSYEDVHAEIIPEARKIVPLYVLKELDARIREILE